MNNFSKSLKNYLTTDEQRIFLQRSYLVVGAAALIASSLVSLFDNDLGRSILAISALAIGLFLANATVFALAKALFEFYLTPETSKKSPTKKQK